MKVSFMQLIICDIGPGSTATTQQELLDTGATCMPKVLHYNDWG